MSLTADILKAYESQISALELVPSSGGAFEVEVNGERVFSKLSQNRYPAAQEIKKLIEARLAR